MQTVLFRRGSAERTMRIMHAAVVGVLGRARVRLPICMCSGLTTHSCRCCSSSIARLRGWLVGLRHQFEVTTFDFIDLMEIDWRGAFTCPNGAKQLTGDGIAIGFKASECFIQRPWEADPDGALVAGTLLQHRIFVAQPAQHQALLKLADPKVGGLPREPLAALKRRIGRMAATAFERALLPLLERAESAGGNMMLAPRGQQQLICSLATTAPANQLLPRVLWGIIAALADGQQPTQPEERSLSQLSPILFRYLRPALSAAALDGDVRALLTAMLKVSGLNQEGAVSGETFCQDSACQAVCLEAVLHCCLSRSHQAGR